MYMKRTACIFLTALALFMSASCSIRQNETRGGQDGKPEQEVSGGSVDIQDATVERIENILTGNVSASLQPSAVYPARDNYLSDSKWGYIDNAGMFVIEPSFSQAFRFQGNGLAVAGRGDRVGLIDRTGNFVADPVYTYINPYSEGRAAAADGEAYVVLDENGRVISEKYLYIGNYKSGRAVYYTRTESGAQLYGYLDENGKSVIQPVYWHATDFEGNRAAVKLNDGLYAVIDRSGKAIKSFECWDMSGFPTGRQPSKQAGWQVRICRQQRERSHTAGFHMLEASGTSGQSHLSREAQEIYGLINENGKFVILPQYDEIRMLVRTGGAGDTQGPRQSRCRFEICAGRY